jgi:hydrogenase nickel incorporation protein HypA/HybF
LKIGDSVHEISIAISIVDCVTEEFKRRGGLAIKAVHLSLGMLAGVDQQALQFCYKAACEGTHLEGSELVINTVTVVVYCPLCATERPPASIQQLACPQCASPTKIISGYELEVAALEFAA